MHYSGKLVLSSDGASNAGSSLFQRALTKKCYNKEYRCEMITYKRNSPEYRKYVENFIEEYNNNGKKTLLFVCDSAYPIVDGVWNVLSSCVKQLRENHPEYNVVVLCPTFHSTVYIHDAPVLSTRSIYLKKIKYQFALPHFDLQLRRWLKKLRIDLIHCHSPFLCGLLMRRLHKKCKVPMVTTFHSQFKQDFMRATKSKVLTNFGLSIIMKVFRDSDETWTMHSASRETLFSYGFKGVCRLMPNGTDMKPFEDYQTMRDKFRTEHNVQNKLMFIFVGRIISQKGVFLIADALAKIKSNGVNFHMYFIGDGPDATRLKNKIRSLGLTEQVTFTGNLSGRDELACYYAGADLFLFPSKYDVSSIVQMEAATYKTPTVFAQGSVTSCTVTDGVNGYVLPYDAQQYAEGVCNIIQSGTLQQVSENALRDLSVGWTEIVNRSVAVYEQLINNKNH